MLVTQRQDARIPDAECALRQMLHDLRPDIPDAAIRVVADDEDLLSAQIHGVEQGLQKTSQALLDEVSRTFTAAHATYDAEEIDALARTFKIIAPKAGVAIEPGSLSLTELPNGVLVLLVGGRAVAASDDPLHLFADALAHLK